MTLKARIKLGGGTSVALEEWEEKGKLEIQGEIAKEGRSEEINWAMVNNEHQTSVIYVAGTMDAYEAMGEGKEEGNNLKSGEGR